MVAFAYSCDGRQYYILTIKERHSSVLSLTCFQRVGCRDESYSVALGVFIFNHSWWRVQHADDWMNYDTEHQYNRSWMDYCVPLLYNPTFYIWKRFTPLYKSRLSPTFFPSVCDSLSSFIIVCYLQPMILIGTSCVDCFVLATFKHSKAFWHFVKMQAPCRSWRVTHTVGLQFLS